MLSLEKKFTLNLSVAVIHPLHFDDLEQEIADLLEKKPRILTKDQIAATLALQGDRRVAIKNILKKLKKDRYAKNVIRKELVPFLKQSKRKGGASSFSATSLGKKSSKSARILPHGFEKKTEKRIGLFLNKQGYGILIPCHRKDSSSSVRIDLESFPEIPHNHVVVYGFKAANQIYVEKILGPIDSPKTYSLMAIHAHGLSYTFSEEALSLARKAKIPPLGQRVDLRNIPFVTIDGEDAKDFDDAVWAAPDSDPVNPGGWRALVAIADVAYYVKSSDPLDYAAYERGNSVYLANHVVPMLPEELSNDLCSLKPGHDRACLAVEMVISANGKIKSHRFKRGLMRSKARLTYCQVQKAIQGHFDETTKSLWDDVLGPLYGVYQSLLKARQDRGTLDLNVLERKIVFDERGHVIEVKPRERHESHQLIEELMIAANVCAAKTLLAKKTPTLFRVHDQPETTRIQNLKTVLKSLKIQIPKVNSFSSSHFQSILSRVDGSPYQQLINDLVLRSQAQACYTPKNIGHFGLSLPHYCHFTSPIRRYADLVVHRGLIAALSLGEDGHDYMMDALEGIGSHISATERTAALAEREVNDRLMAAYLESHIGEVFQGTIVGVSGVGIFVGLDGTGAQGFIPKNRLGDDYYVYDAGHHQYRGQRTKKVYQLGQRVTVRLESADSVACSTTFSLYNEKEVKKAAKRRTKKPEKKLTKSKKNKR